MNDQHDGAVQPEPPARAHEPFTPFVTNDARRGDVARTTLLLRSPEPQSGSAASVAQGRPRESLVDARKIAGVSIKAEPPGPLKESPAMDADAYPAALARYIG